MSHAGLSIPVVKTGRLILRGYAPDDFRHLAALWGDPSVTRFISGQPSTPSESWLRLLSSAGHWALLGFGYWLAEERQSGRFVGQIGMADFKRDIEPGFDGAPEVGWVLSPSAHGKGYATEAVQAALAWAESNLGAKRYVCIVDPQNQASLRVADKCGFTPFAETELKGSSVILMERVAGKRL